MTRLPIGQTKATAVSCIRFGAGPGKEAPARVSTLSSGKGVGFLFGGSFFLHIYFKHHGPLFFDKYLLSFSFSLSFIFYFIFLIL
ncbi:MAG: hypothetical protein Q8P67_26325 [archaeon]|nr:hypothetical protein [archaeon]